MKVAIIGVGTVGTSVAKILLKNQDIITPRAGVKIEPVIGVVRNLAAKKDAPIPLSDDINAVLERDDIDVYVELMGGVDEAYKVVKRALERKKPVVTANKALLAYHRDELARLAGDTPFGFEASVAGGIPIIKTLRDGLSANHINSITGILNGTSNYILSAMMKGGVEFKDALKKAQELGYAEADPSFDIGGFDAAHKLLILASIAYDIHAKPEDILIEGIEHISSDDIAFAKEFEYEIKLLGLAKRVGNAVELRVHPALVPQEQMIAKVNGVMNAISVVGDAVGETMYYGAGAGGDATASAVISDLIDIARGTTPPMLGYKEPFASLALVAKDEIKSKFYFRLNVKDKLGVLASITKLMSEHNLSVDAILQRRPQAQGVDTGIFIITHMALEKDACKFIDALKGSEFLRGDVFMMRINQE